VNRTFLVESHASVKGTVGAKQVQSSFSVITLARFVDICLGQDEQRRAAIVPLELNLVAFEESLLRYGVMEDRDIVDLHNSWLTLERR
jgi:hypothetical protein